MAEARPVVVVEGEEPTVAVDFDLTLFDENEMPLPGAARAISYLKETGWKVIVWTSRVDTDHVRGLLVRNNIPFDHINENPEVDAAAYTRKVYFHATVDDKAIPFSGDWGRAVRELDRRRSIWELGDGTEVKVMGIDREGCAHPVARFQMEGSDIVERMGSPEAEVLKSGLETDEGIVRPKDGSKFLKALTRLQGTYLWAEVSH